MMLPGHIVASSVTAAWFGVTTQSPVGTIACFLSGIFIDLDHVLDFYIFKKNLPRSYKELKDFCLDPSGKIYLFLHSYELMAFLWVVVFCFKPSVLFVGLLFGMSVHLLLDQLTNAIYPLAYFIFYRLKLGFPKVIFFRDQPVKEIVPTIQNP